MLLLFNSLFSYLIMKFADYFGLKKPCLWCSRLDRALEPGKSDNSYRDLVCEAHASEISKLGYCLNHRRLAESLDMCEDCSSSSQPDSPELSKRFAFFPWINKIGLIEGGEQKVSGNGEGNSMCSCCGVRFENKFYPPCILIKPSWGDSDYSQRQNLIAEPEVDAQIDDGDCPDRSRSDFTTNLCEDDAQSFGEYMGIEIVSGDVLDGGCGRRDEEKEENCSVCDFGCKELIADEDDNLDKVIEEKREPVKEENLNVPSLDKASVHGSCRMDASLEIRPQHLEFFIDRQDCKLIPVEFIGAAAMKDQRQPRYKLEDLGDCNNQDVILDLDMSFEAQTELVVENWHSLVETVASLPEHENEEKPKVGMTKSQVPVETQSISVLLKEEKDFVGEEHEQVAVTEGTQMPSNGAVHEEPEVGITQSISVLLTQEKDFAGEEHEHFAMTEGTQTPSNGAVHEDQAATAGEMHSEFHLVSEEAIQLQSDKFETEISIGIDIPAHEPLDEARAQVFLPSYEHRQEDASTSAVILHVADDEGSRPAEEEMLEFQTMPVEIREKVVNSHKSLCSELNEIEEEKVPDTPTSVESLNHLNQKLLLLEKKESGTESLDGSVISEIEGGELTTEKLVSALKAQRKALSALYAELEEERSSSAVAANQTMAMINRLQEEKAAMQMEALHYQRMMDEQTEYDQEALQLLNELMVKTEKEKQQLEKELEICRKKVQVYESNQKMMMSRRRIDGSTRSSVSYSNAEDSDDLSIDLNHELKDEDSFYGNQESSNLNTPADAVLYLEESLANFEEERISILQQLKKLEDKLFMLSDEEEQHFEDVKPVEYPYQENGNGYHKNSDSDCEVNGAENGHSKEMNGKHHQERRIKVSNAKTLLPLFDALDADCNGALVNGHEQGFDSVALQKSLDTKFEMEKKLAIEEEVDHVYERLQALEGDREFLKHCISSLKKGDKGLDLLQEILEHLRDLRSVELRVRKMGDGVFYSL